MNQAAAAEMSLPQDAAQEAWRERLVRLRYRYWPDHWLGEILAKRWTETAIPVLLLLIVVLISGRLVNNFYSRWRWPTPCGRRARSASSCWAWRW